MLKNQERETENRFKSRRTHYFRAGIGKCIWILVLFALISTAQALKLPDEYGDEQCELIAKDYQREFGGDLIFIQPLKENGAYDLGAYNGKWLNRAWNKELGSYYVDWESQTYFKTIDDVKDWYERTEGKKAVVFNVNQGGVPFALYWHY